MIISFLLSLFSILALSLNLNSMEKLSNVTPIVLILEHIAVMIVAYGLISYQLKPYNKKYVVRFFNVFMISYIISLLILHFNWMQYLEQDTFNELSFDPQRYYDIASEYVDREFEGASMNYVGIVYIYAILFRTFGLDPLVPLFINELLALYATLLITNVFAKKKESAISFFVFILLIPELLYYNVLSSREVLSMGFATIVACKIYALQSHYDIVDVIILTASFFLLAVVRTPFAMTAALGYMLFVLLSKKRKKSTIFWGVLVICVAGYIGLSFSESLGSAVDSDELENMIESRTGGENEAHKNYNYSANSVTRLLIPHNQVQFVVFGVIRSFLYVIPSPGEILHPLSIFSGFKGAMPSAYGTLTTFLMFYFLILLYFHREYLKSYFSNNKFFCLYFLAFFLVVGMFNTILVHHRYRIVSDLLFFSLAIEFIMYLKNNKKTK